jgi:TonB family protein
MKTILNSFNNMKPIVFICYFLISFHIFSQKKDICYLKGIPMVEKSSVSYDSSKTGPVYHSYAGVTLSEGDVLNGLRTGLWKFYSLKDSGLSFTGHYKKGMYDGQWKYFSNKKIISKIYYKNGLPDSTWKSYYESGSIRAECYYRNGFPDSVWRIYYENGKAASETYYRNGKWAGKAITFYPDSQIRSIEVVSQSDSVMTNYKSYYKNGKLRYELIRKNDMPYTTVAYFDNNGIPLDNGNLVNGTGVFKEYYDTVKTLLFSEVKYENGLMNGELVCYNKDGSSAVMGTMLEGKKNGKWKFHDLKYKQDYEENILNDSLGFQNDDFPDLYFNVPLKKRHPSFPGEDFGLLRFLQINTMYPQKEKENGVQGKVYISFSIAKDGNLTEIKVYKGVKGGLGLDKEALRVVRGMPCWSPGTQNEIPVQVKYILPINFMLR